MYNPWITNNNIVDFKMIQNICQTSDIALHVRLLKL